MQLVKAHNEAEEAQPAKKKADKEPKKVEKKEKAGPKPAEKSKPPAATTGALLFGINTRQQRSIPKSHWNLQGMLTCSS